MKPTPRTLRVALAALALALPLGIAAQTQTLVNDPFTDGGHSSGADSADTAWSAAYAALSVVSDSGTGQLDAGNALAIAPSAHWSSLAGDIPEPSSNPVPGAGALKLSTGDSVKLTLRFRIAGTPADLSNGLRFGLGSAAGTYGFDLGTGTSPGAQFRRYHDGAVAKGANTALTTTGNTPQAVGDSTPRTLTLTVRRDSTATLTLTAQLITSNTLSWSATETGAPLDTFDSIVLTQGATAMPLRVDDVKVEFIPKALSKTRRLALWKFDELATGDAQVHAWDDTTAANDLELRSGGGVSDQHTSGSDLGPSGLATDRALASGGHGILYAPQESPAWQNSPALTFSGWIKVDSVPGNSARLLDWTGDQRVELWFPYTGRLALQIGGGAAGTVNYLSPQPGGQNFITAADVGQWVFIAVVYRANQGANGVKFYRGTPTTAATLFGQTGDTTAFGNIRNLGAGNLHLGNNSAANRKFPGKIDHFSVFDAEITDALVEGARKSGLAPAERLFSPAFDTAEGWGINEAEGPGVGYATSSAVEDSAHYTSSPVSRRYAVTTLSGTAQSRYVQVVQLHAGKTYRGKIKIRSESASAGKKIRFILRKTAAYYDYYAVKTVVLDGAGTWQEHVIEGGSGDTASAFFGIEMLQPDTTVWLDDASLAELIDAPAAPVSTASLGAIPGTLFGLHIHWPNYGWPQMGQKIVRLWDTGTRWGDLETAQDDWVWSRFDTFMNFPSNNGAPNTDVLYTLGMPPKWAVSDHPKERLFRNTWNTPDSVSTGAPDIGVAPGELINTANWTDYVSRVGNRGLGKIKYWEIWNEANVSGSHGFYSGSMAQMVEMAYQAGLTLKGIDGDNKLISPNTTIQGPPWLENYLIEASNRGPAYLDAVDVYALHIYSGLTPEDIRPHFAAMKDILSRYPGQSSKPIWNTEGSSFAGTADSDEERGGVVCRSFIVQWLSGASNYNWYFFGRTSAGLVELHEGGNPPALSIPGEAYRETVNWLRGATAVNKTITPSVYGRNHERWIVEISRPGGYRGWIVWDTSRVAHNWTIPASWGPTSFKLRRLNGPSSTVSAGNALQIGPIPVLLESGTARAALVDFGSGSYLSGGACNNITNTTPAGAAIALKDANGNTSDLTLTITSPFNTSGANTGGVTSPQPPADAYPGSATRDSLYGNTASFGGQINRHPVLTIAGLDPRMRYQLTYFASRTGTPTLNRTTDYALSNDVVTDVRSLDAQDNVEEVASSAFLAPRADGTLTLSIGANAANTTAEKFTYLGVLDIRVASP